jgi:hypothetical protein
MIERGALATYQRQHAAYSRRVLGIFDVAGDVSGELPLPAAGAPVVSAEHFGGTQYCKDGFEPPVLISSLAAACAGHTGRNWPGLAEKFTQTRRSSRVECSSKRQLHGLDVQFAGTAPFGKDARQQSV